MSKYYHDFTVGFNYWMVLAAAWIIVMVLIGIMRYKLNDHLEIRYRYNAKIYEIFATLGALPFGMLLFVESSDGIVQFFDNTLVPGESPVYSLIAAGFGIVFAAIMFFAISLGIAVVSGWAREGYLHARRRAIVREEKEERQAVSPNEYLRRNPSRSKSKKRRNLAL